MNKQKRMIYVYEENLAFYDELKNKSQFINDALQDARINVRIKDALAKGGATPSEDEHPDPRIRETRRQVREMEERDRKRQEDARG